MEIDELDLYLLNSINSKETSTWEMAKYYFKIDPEKYELSSIRKIKIRDLSKRMHTIKNRLTKMQRWGLIIITKEKEGNRIKNVYNLISENIQIGRHKFPDGYKDSFCLKINSKWTAFEV